MPKRTNRPRCRCFSLHTYTATVTNHAWSVSRFVCELCGAEHFVEFHPELSPPPTAEKKQGKPARRRSPASKRRA